VSTVVGIDPSLTSLGLCGIVDGVIGNTSRVRSKGKEDATLAQRDARRSIIMVAVMAYVDLYQPDLVCIEGPSYASRNGHPHDRSGLWWGLVADLLAYGCVVVEVPPTNRMKYATGKGMIAKDMVLAAAIKRYPEANITGNDEADAVIIAAMGARHLGEPVEASMPKVNLDAMKAVHW